MSKATMEKIFEELDYEVLTTGSPVEAMRLADRPVYLPFSPPYNYTP